MTFLNRTPNKRGTQVQQRRLLGPRTVAALVAFFVLATGLSGYIIYDAVRDWVSSRNLPGLGVRPTFGQGTLREPEERISGKQSEGVRESSDISSSSGWGTSERATVLVMGIDQRAGLETDSAYRTDSMMLISLDPIGETGGILSIPRDLWVQIPGFEGRDRINTANFKGDAYRLPGGGPALAMETVTTNLGIPVEHYVRINFTAFEEFVDEIGGIDLDVPQVIDDPTYPDCCFGYDPFYIRAGPQHLDGRRALQYARTRVTFGGDFDRAERQQEVILAIRDKLLNMNMLSTLVKNAPNLYSTLETSFDTNLSLDQIITLANVVERIDREDVRTAVIDEDYILDEFVTADGAQVVVLDSQSFRLLRETMFYQPAALAAATIDPEKLAKQEGATVEVRNGAARAGIAKATADYLTNNGFNVVSVGNADFFDYENTLIYDYTGRYYTTRWIAEHFEVEPARIIARSDPNSPVDVLVIIGRDFTLP